MPTFIVDRSYTTQEADEIAAQRIACALLVTACKTASFHFGVQSSYAASGREERLNRRAANIVNDIVASWAETLAMIETMATPQPWLGEMALEGQGQRVDSNPRTRQALP